MENDEEIIKYKGKPYNSKYGCSNDKNFKVDYKQIRHFPPNTDIIKLLKEHKDEITENVAYGNQKDSPHEAWAQSFEGIEFDSLKVQLIKIPG